MILNNVGVNQKILIGLLTYKMRVINQSKLYDSTYSY